jgi:hypothetical protein
VNPLQVHDFPDPSTSNNERMWQELIVWVERRLAEMGTFERHKMWVEVRTEYFSTKNRLYGVICLLTHFRKSGHTRTLLMEKFFGSSIPKSLALEWMKRACVE